MEKKEGIYNLLKYMENSADFRTAYTAVHGETAVEELTEAYGLPSTEEELNNLTDEQYAKVRKQLLRSNI